MAQDRRRGSRERRIPAQTANEVGKGRRMSSTSAAGAKAILDGAAISSERKLENGESDPAARRRQEEVEALLESARAVLKHREFADAARVIFDRCKALIGASAGYVALLSSEGTENEVLFLDSGGLPCSVDPTLPMPIRGLRAQVYQTGQAAYENDFASSRWAQFMPEGHATLDSVLFAPLTIEGAVVGLLGIANKPGGFSQNDARLATAFGELAAVALSNSRTLEALQNSEHRFHSLVETASDAIVCANGSGEIVLWNRGAEAMFGYPAAEAIGQPVTLIMPERFHERHRQGLKRFLATGKPRIMGRTIEMSGLRSDGSEFPVELSLTSWKAKQETFFAGVIRDVGERKRAEDALRESEAWFRSIYMESPIGIELYDADGHLIDANPACLQIFGISSVEDVRGFALFDDPNLSKEAIAALRRGERVSYEVPFDFEKIKVANLYPTSRSGIIYLSVVLTPLGLNDNDGITGYLVQVLEVTRERVIQEELRESEERFRLLTENATDGIYRFRLDPPGYEYVSPAMTTLFGYEREEWLFDPDLDHKIVHPDDQPLIDKMRTPSGMLTGLVILRCHHKDGTPIWIEHHNAPVQDESGKVVAIQGIVRDVTERMQSMEDMERLRSDFLGMVTHELKTPLAAIKGSAATALGSPRPLDYEEIRELFQIIDEQSDRLRDLTDNLLDISRIEAGSLSVKPEPLDLRSVIEEALSIMARSGRSQRIEVEMPAEMPAVNADKRRLVQVLTNLLTNAAKFSSAATPIKIGVEHDALLATVRVQDEGQGIASDKLPLLFQKFSQVHDSGKTRATGTGLGLAICKGIVEAHGGRIWAESDGEGKGATFSFTLPLAAEAAATPAKAATPTMTAGVRRSERPRVLAVDDELPVLRYLQHSLDEAGYQCVVTSDPSQVTKFVELEQPDLILLDLRLPGVSGFDLLARIREFSAAPVIFLTASDSSEDTVRALKLGADDYVTKPFAPSELLARIEAALRRRSLPGVGESRPPFKVKGLEINFAERRVILEGKEISLSATEYKLLYELATHSGLVMTFDQILQRVWGAEYAGETELVRSFIRNLRRKLNDDAKQPRYIFTERQIGYRMVKE